MIVVAVAAALFLPWLGSVLFYTKGEPREAVVAVSMLQTGNWILPASFGTDLPYKPPLLAWLIALCSELFNGGTVSEWTARMPSALAAVGLLTATWAVVERHAGQRRAWLTMLVLATCFEIFRAATACRVDMLLTACMVCAVYALWPQRLRWYWAVTGVLMLSGAILAKGPVGALLPCLALGLAMLADRRGLWRTLGRLVPLCLLSFVLPAFWYWAAYKQGGQQFLDLAWEENIGRLTGSMSYDSHVNPWYYNVWSMLAGLLPWTVPALLAFTLRAGRTGLRRAWQQRSSWATLCWTAAATVFVFYCIPESKRSVYLLPCYPFIAYGLVWLMERVGGTVLMRVWCVILAVLSLAAPLVLGAASLGYIKGVTVTPLEWWQWAPAALPAVIAAWMLLTRRMTGFNLAQAVALTYCLVVAYNGAYMGAFLNARSDRQAALVIERTVPAGDKIVGVIEGDSLSRYYSINYYLGDKLTHARRVEDVADNAWVITDSANAPRLEGRRLLTVTRRSADTRQVTVLAGPRVTRAAATGRP